MKTFKAEEIRKVVHFIAGEQSNRYCRFTVYRHGKRPLKIKARLVSSMCGENGVELIFASGFFCNRKRYKYQCRFAAKNIRWIDPPMISPLWKLNADEKAVIGLLEPPARLLPETEKL